MDQNPILRIEGKEFSLGDSETGPFGLTKKELKAIICNQLNETSNHKRKPRTLLNLVLRFLKMGSQGKHKEEFMKVFIEILHEMKNEGLIVFHSGKTAMFVSLR